MLTNVDLRILGSLEVCSGGQPVALGGAKQRSLLCILILHANQVVAVDRIAEELWTGDPPITYGHTVQVYISNLRKALGADSDRLVTRSPGYLLRVDEDELDLTRFEHLLAEGRRALAEEAAELAIEKLADALSLWRGPALADFAYEPFALIAIARLEELRLAALEERLDAELACGRHVALVPELDVLVREHPLREGLRAQLMLALYRSGRQVEALEVFQRTRRDLVDELGIEPSPALQRLERAILVQDESLEWSERPRAEHVALTGRERSILLVAQDDDSLHRLCDLAEPLAWPPSRHELIVVRLVAVSEPGAGFEQASALLAKCRTELAQRGIAARTASFSASDSGRDLVRFTTREDVDLLVLPVEDAALTTDAFPQLITAALSEAPCDVALMISGESTTHSRGLPVLVPFGGSEHDWAALELGAWFARACNSSLRLLGVADASRLLAHASLAVQQLVGVASEPILVAEGPEGVLEVAQDAGLLVVGLPEMWRQQAFGDARFSIAQRVQLPLVFVRRGVRPGGLAPKETLTRFTWSLAGAGTY